MSRPDLLALTPQSVAALANLGLVKRAQREIEAGKAPALDEGDDGVVTGTFEDGVVTRIPPNVPLRDAPCSCGASSVCRHRVAVVLAYPSWFAGPESVQRRAALAATEEWSPACFSDDDLLALVGKRIMARAQTLARSGVVLELEGGAMPLAKLPTSSVRFHVPRDLAYARCDCQTSIACEHVVVAAWAFRRAEEERRELPCTIELGGRARTLNAPSSLDEARILAAHILLEGIANVGEQDKPRFAKVRAALSSAGLLWPSVIVDDLERLLESYRERSARYRTREGVFLLTSLEARSRALRAERGELPPRFLLGSDEARDTLLDHVRLISLGARIEADGDKREASVYLADPDSGVVLVARRELSATRATGASGGEGPELARRILTGRVTLGALARGQLVTRAAKRHANHTLSLATTRTSQTSVAPSSGDWECLPENLLIRDLDKLSAALGARPPRVLRPLAVAAEVKVLALPPDPVRAIGYRHGDQELVIALSLSPKEEDDAPIIHLVRRHSRTGPSALDAIAKAFRGPAAPRFVAGDVRLGPHGLEIDPTAVVTDRVIVPDLETESPIVESLPFLQRRVESPMHTALMQAESVLEEVLHDGLLHARGGLVERVGHVSEALSAVGARGTARRFSALRDAVKRDARTATGAWLDAAMRLELTREATLD